ncbi:MAG: hypothetical protein AVDCRST_MAG42-595, partial [uncultured Chthoniobacterales bacterium]
GARGSGATWTQPRSGEPVGTGESRTSRKHTDDAPAESGSRAV